MNSFELYLYKETNKHLEIREGAFKLALNDFIEIVKKTISNDKQNTILPDFIKWLNE